MQPTLGMRNLFFVIKTWFTKGTENQSFIGAAWLVWLIRLTPSLWRRKVALRVLALSPHYFYPDISDEYESLSRSDVLEAEYRRNKSSRLRIRDEILGPFLNPAKHVLDYGCGPGFLASAVAEKVSKVTAVDLSRGVLACAKVINGGKNIDYVHTSEFDEIPSNEINLVYSFAVIQHVTDEVFAHILKDCARVLKPGGQLVVHVVLEPEGWKDQAAWEADDSLSGRVKLKYGLNCFSRTTTQISSLVEAAGFNHIKISAISDLCEESFDDICSQHLLTAVLEL